MFVLCMHISGCAFVVFVFCPVFVFVCCCCCLPLRLCDDLCIQACSTGYWFVLTLPGALHPDQCSGCKTYQISIRILASLRQCGYQILTSTFPVLFCQFMPDVAEPKRQPQLNMSQNRNGNEHGTTPERRTVAGPFGAWN